MEKKYPNSKKLEDVIYTDPELNEEYEFPGFYVDGKRTAGTVINTAPLTGRLYFLKDIGHRLLLIIFGFGYLDIIQACPDQAESSRQHQKQDKDPAGHYVHDLIQYVFQANAFLVLIF